MKFYRTVNGELVNLSKIEAITPVKLKQIYDKDKENDLNMFGRAVINSIREDKWSEFGGKHVPQINPNCYIWNIDDSVFGKDDIVSYVIHLGCSSGGINVSHLMIFITPKEKEILEKHLEIV